MVNFFIESASLHENLYYRSNAPRIRIYTEFTSI